MTVNEHETRAIHDAFLAATGSEGMPEPLGGRLYHNLGAVNGTTVYHAISEMASGGSGGMQQTVERAIITLDPGAVIAVGIAFGVNEEKQAIGDIIVSKLLRLYELQRVCKGSQIVLRGARPDASPRLISHFRAFYQTKWNGARVRMGVMLTGEKLVDNVDYRKQLLDFESEAEGGEMEGAGLYAASHDNKVDWIVIKAICDWADGNKGVDKDARQQLAAKNSAEFFVESLKYAPLHHPGFSPRKTCSGVPGADTRRFDVPQDPDRMVEPVGAPPVSALRNRVLPPVGPEQSDPFPEWQARLERSDIKDDMRIYGVVRSEPKIEILGPYNPPENYKPSPKAEAAFKDAQRLSHDPGEPYAMLCDEPRLEFPGVTRLPVHTLTWAFLEMLRADEMHDGIVSANAIVVCAEERVLVLQLRSPKSRTWASCLHIIGGGYRPPGVRDGWGDRSLLTAAEREIHEEIHIPVSMDGKSPMLLSKETSSKFFQFTVLGVPISVELLKRCRLNWKGAIEEPTLIGFDELAQRLKDSHTSWVPTAKGIILAWLAHGAPCAGPNPRFGDKDPHQLFNAVTGTC